jgi:hypothetical protein
MILGGWEDLDPVVQHEVKKLELEKQVAEAKLRASTIHNRILWVSLIIVTVINLIFAWGCVRHMRLWHSF